MPRDAEARVCEPENIASCVVDNMAEIAHATRNRKKNEMAQKMSSLSQQNCDGKTQNWMSHSQ